MPPTVKSPVRPTGLASRPMDSRSTIVAALGTVVLGLGALHVWWLHRFRDGFAVDIDETGYLWFAYHLHDVRQADGLLGVWDRFRAKAGLDRSCRS